MTAQAMTRTLAGLFIIFSLVMAHVYGQADLSKLSWLWFTAFIGVNLFQSGLSGWCMLTNILKKMGLRSA
ncbi:MAG: DUF2892 domain-containing protein [Rhodobacteraceae bacterium]|nr:DUF2892 domain-containing protein [Paracoccaceae bacterium]